MTKLAIGLVTGCFCVALSQWASPIAPTEGFLAELSLFEPISVASAPARHAPTGAAEANEMVAEYCTRCHSERRRRGELVLDGFDIADAANNGVVVEKMIRKLRGGMMPPAGTRRPTAEVLALVVDELESTMDRLAEESPNPGSRIFQRLNRAEYFRAVDDLLGIQVDVKRFLPLDTKSANFDNIADVQMPSATVMEGYLRAAGHISRLALGDPDAEVASAIYRISRIGSQKEHVMGTPIGTRGGISITHNFPADGKYVFHVMPYASTEGEVFGRPFGEEQLDITIDGVRVALLTVDHWMSESEPTGLNIRSDSIRISAGPHQVAVAFVRRFEGEVDDLMRPIYHTLADGEIGIGRGVTSQQHLQRVTILGPFGVTGVSETPTRKAVFVCRPTAPTETRPCARRVIRRLATRAYRRPATERDLDALLTFYDEGERKGGFEGGVRSALQAILASPYFLFRMEPRPAGVDPGEVYRISDVALASRLSFFLWGSPPDAELQALAERGELAKAIVIRQQVRRMIADPRSEALGTRFAGQWLRLQDLDKIHPDALTYPYFDQTLSDAMLRETELFFNYLVREDRSVIELLSADYTFLNERLARHYGVTGITGGEFRKVSYPGEARRGLLGHGSILTLTSHPDRTSPVLRGKWVLEVLMGAPPPPPPPGIPDLEETAAADGGRAMSVRERLAIHRAAPACNSCHQVMDPIGLALENFDVTGAWRTRDEGNLVDPSGELFDGTPLSGVGDLRSALVNRSEVFYRVFTENLMAYALGRRLEYYDMPAVRKITSNAAENDYRIGSFILGVIESPAFQMTQAGIATDGDPEQH